MSINKKVEIDLTQETPLKDKIAGFKLIARDALRMKLISKRASKLSTLESEMKITDKRNYKD